LSVVEIEIEALKSKNKEQDFTGFPFGSA